MGKRIIISESEKKNILSLYEEDNNIYKKENDFLKKYIGKTFNIYEDINEQTLYSQALIKNITYNGGRIIINTEYSSYDFVCQYNPSRIGYKGYGSYNREFYNKSLITDINIKGNSIGIKWCQKPKSDFGTKTVNEETNVTPPPSESIFVANKNPFKYPEYENARKVYSNNLNDGDLFYKTNNLFESFVSNNMFNKFYESFLGKTIRIPTSDEIITIEKYDINNKKENIRYRHKDENPVNIGTIEFLYKIKNIVQINFANGLNGETSWVKDYNYGNPKEIENVLNIMKEKLKSHYLHVFSDLSQFPDEYFEIRQVKRQQTDF
jgi:hypothetical protein